MATKYPITGGGNWSDGATWNTSPNQSSSNTTAPSSSDDVILDEYGGAVVVNAAACVCKTLTCNHANANLTFTASQKLTVSGDVTFITGMTLAGTGTLNIDAAATLTSGGLTFPGALTLTGANTKTLSGNWINTGLVTFATANTVLNLSTAETLTCLGGLAATGSISGTATIILGGTGGTWSGTGAISNNLTINCTTLTISGNVYYAAGTLTYTAGTVTVTGSTLILRTAGMTLNTSGMTWNNVTLNTSGLTYTLASDLICSGTLNASVGSNITVAGAYDITCRTLWISGNGATLTLPAGQTITITGSILVAGTVAYGMEIKSSTPSSSVYLVYSGTAADCKVFAGTFTDIDASGSTQGIDNWYGGTLTRTSGITNRTSADIGGAVADVFGIIG